MRHKKSFEEAREEELAHLKVKNWKEDELLHRQRQERADQLLQQGGSTLIILYIL